MGENSIVYRLSVSPPIKYTAIGLLFSLVSLLWIINLLDDVGLPISPEIHRVTYYSKFQVTLTGNANVDFYLSMVGSLAIIALLSGKKYCLNYIVPALISFLILLSFFYPAQKPIYELFTFPSIVFLFIADRKNASIDWRRIFSYGLYAFIVLEALSLISWISLAIGPSPIFKDAKWQPSQVELMLFYALADLAPYVSMLLIFSFLIKPYAPSILAYIQKYFHFGTKSAAIIENVDNSNKIRNWSVLILFIFLGIALSFYPYESSFDPKNQPLGTDTPQYVQHINTLLASKSPLDAFQYAFTGVNGGDRPLTILFMSFVKVVTGIDTRSIVLYFPAILMPILLSTEFLFLSAITKKTKFIIISLGFTFFSYQFLIGIFAAFYANWLAICLMYVIFYLLIRTWNRPRILSLVWLTLTLIGVSLVHVYTWTFILGTLIVFLILHIVKSRSEYRKARNVFASRLVLFLVTAIIASILFDVARTSLISGSVSGFESDAVVSSNALDFSQFAFRWNNLGYSFSTYLGGLLSNTIMLVLALIWAIFRSSYDKVSDRILLSSFFVGTVPILFGDYSIQSRILYNMPIQIAAAFLIAGTFSDKRKRTFFVVLSVFIILQFSNVLFRTLANLVFVSPSALQ